MKRKQIIEKHIGTLQQDEISVDNFRPTQSQQLIILNLGELIDSGRENIREQDVLNIPRETLDQNNLSASNIEGAFEMLKQVGIIEVGFEGEISLSEAGTEILEMIRQFQEPKTEPGQPEPGEETPMPDDELEIDLASLDLLGLLNKNSKFLNG